MSGTGFDQRHSNSAIEGGIGEILRSFRRTSTWKPVVEKGIRSEMTEVYLGAPSFPRSWSTMSSRNYEGCL